MLLDTLPPAAHVARAARGLAGTEDAYVLGFHPVARMNPYQALLYSRAHYSGFAPVGLMHVTDFGALDTARAMGVGAVLHLHWTTSVLSEARDEGDARRRASDFLHEIRGLQERGIKFVWSVHNVLPHSCRYPEIEAELRSGLAAAADAVHIMASDTVDATSSHYRLPHHKVFEVDHPSYVGAYPSYLDRRSARFELGLEPSDLAFGVVGSIQPYKGLAEFALAAERIGQMDASARFIVAGIPGRDEASRQLIADLQRVPCIELIARKLSDTEISVVIGSLDAVVLPYRASLNSGVAMMALTLGIPIVAPLTGSFRQLIDEGFGVGYPPSSPNGLLDALRSLQIPLEGFDPDKAARVANSLAGPLISEKFFAKLRELLDRRGQS